MRLHFLLSLIRDCSENFLDTTQVFKVHNTIVTYRCSSYDDTDVLRLHHEFSRYEHAQIFYLTKNDDQAQPVTAKLITNCTKGSLDEEKEAALRDIRYIELFKLDENPFYFEDEQKWKTSSSTGSHVGQKRDQSDVVKAEAEDAKLTKAQLGRPMPFKLSKMQCGAGLAESEQQYSVSALFEPIIGEIRDYLENLAKGGDEE